MNTWQRLLTIASLQTTISISLSAPTTSGDTPTTDCLFYYVPPHCETKCFEALTQGPCRHGQVFEPITEDLDVTLLRGEAFGESFCNDAIYVRNVDFDKEFVTLCNKTSYGYCVWNEPDHPCYGSSANHRFSDETQICHAVGLQEYCPENQVFYAYDIEWEEDSNIYGECDCILEKGMWYYPGNGNCYRLHSQGPCKEGEWLAISNEENTLKCQSAPCPTNGSYVYWTLGHEQCFVLGDKGPCPIFGHDGEPSQEVLIRSYPGVTCGLPQDDHEPVRNCLSDISSKLQHDESRCSANIHRSFDFSCGLSDYSRLAKRCLYGFATLAMANITNPPPSPSHSDSDKCLLPHPAWGCVNPFCYDVSTQGPCSDKQIFVEIPDFVNKDILRSAALGKGCAYNYGEAIIFDRDVDLDPDVNKTLPPLVNPNQKYGYCVWNDTNHPCNGRPANQRFSNETQACHTLGLQEYCGEHQTFYEVFDGYWEPFYGACDCTSREKAWYDPINDSCFIPHSQGACPDGHWLTMNSTDGPAVCEPTPCPADGNHVLWTYEHQSCYLRDEQGPCLSGDKLTIFPGELLCEESGGGASGVLSIAMAPERHSATDLCRQGLSKRSPKSKQCTFRNSPCGTRTYSRTLKRCV